MAAPKFDDRARRGFTLIELLVVIGILVVLAGIIVPSVNRARLTAARTRMAMDLSAIEQALEAYRADHGDYPRVLGIPNPVYEGYDGAVALCQALLAPGKDDNKDGSTDPKPGFKTRAGGKLYGPYVRPEDFTAGYPPRDPTATVPTDPPTQYCLLDRFDRPILYFPASLAKPNVRLPSAANPPYVGPSDVASLYDYRDNFTADEPPAGLFGPFGRKASDDADALKRIRLMLGDFHGAAPPSDPDGVIQADETPVEKPFLLWSAGPDQRYGPELLNPDYAQRCDDVTNFR